MVCRSSKILFTALSAVVLVACGGGGGGGSPSGGSQVVVPAADPCEVFDASEVNPCEVASGGGVTVNRSDETAFSLEAPELDFIQSGQFAAGDALFENPHAGRGPIFNATACQGCHINDGRGNPPDNGDDALTTTTEAMVSMFLRLSISGTDPQNGVVGDPVYGDQLQTFGVGTAGGANAKGLPVHDGGISGLADDALGEGFAFIEYEEITGDYPSGESWSLRKPTYKVRDLSYGAFDPAILFSPRVAPATIGLGLLEAIPEADILANADPNDVDGDSITGRPNYAWDALQQERVLGRMGLKANQPSILQQLAGAYRGDIGITNPVFTEEPCTTDQTACNEAMLLEQTVSPDTDASDVELALVEFYQRTLAVPIRRGWSGSSQSWEQEIWDGRRLFIEANCTGCHTPTFKTGTAAGSVLGDVVALTSLSQPATPIDALSDQRIFPFSDMLLHDMGGSCQPVAREDARGNTCTGDSSTCFWVQRCDGLADGRTDFEATGTEWRTPPLWGLGLVEVVNQNARYLHDGRARTIEEAILWHGGEAEDSRQFFVDLTKAERDAVLAFLMSL